MAPATLRLVRDTETATSPAAIRLPDRHADLDQARDHAIEAALQGDVVADMREAAATLLARLARRPGDLQGLLMDYGRRMYVAGRMDQRDDDQLGRAQTRAMSDAAMAQVVQLAEYRGAGA